MIASRALRRGMGACPALVILPFGKRSDSAALLIGKCDLHSLAAGVFIAGCWRLSASIVYPCLVTEV